LLVEMAIAETEELAVEIVKERILNNIKIKN
jgi:hypothetical protein